MASDPEERRIGLIDVSGLAPDAVTFRDRNGMPLDQAPTPEAPALVVETMTSPPPPPEPAEVTFDVLPPAPDAAWWPGHAHHFAWNDRRGVLEFAPGRPAHPARDPSLSALLPSLTLEQIAGQPRAVASLDAAAKAARLRGRAASHVLLEGAPGLGKTSLAEAYAAAIGTRLHQAAAPLLKDPGALLGLLARLEPRDVVFLDEIHALPPRVAESLYEAMENRRLSLLVTDGTRTRSLALRLEPFTLVGATTAPDQVPAPLLMRFPLREPLEFYAPEVLAGIVTAAAQKDGLEIEPAAAALLARAGRDTPREALSLLARVANRAVAASHFRIAASLVSQVLADSGFGEDGQDPTERKLLALLRRSGQARPLGLHRLAAMLGSSPRALREVHKPFLLRRGLLATTPRGRIAPP